MKFDTSWRMIKDGDYAWGSYRLTGDNERTLRDILLPMSRLLFHELAHANDAIQKEISPSLLATDTPSSSIKPLALKDDYPLVSPIAEALTFK